MHCSFTGWTFSAKALRQTSGYDKRQAYRFSIASLSAYLCAAHCKKIRQIFYVLEQIYTSYETLTDECLLACYAFDVAENPYGEQGQV